MKLCQNQLPPLFCTVSRPVPRKDGTWYMVCVWEGLSGDPWCRAGHTLKRCNQLAFFVIHPVRWDATVVWLVDDGVHQVRLFLAPIWCLSGGGDTRETEGGTVARSLVGRRNTRKRTVARSIGRVTKTSARVKGSLIGRDAPGGS